MSANEKANKAKDALTNEQRLLHAIIVLVILMNIPYGRNILYPFRIFSTWVHEMGHGTAAILCGGRIKKIYVNQNGSGVCYSSMSGGGWYTFKRVIVSSAGYVGTAIAGGVMLLFRRTERGPRIGTIGVGVVMLISCAFFVRNEFGLWFCTSMGLVLVIAGWFMTTCCVGELYAFLAVTCCLNAITNIDQIFDMSEDSDSDAHTVEDLLLLPYWWWASCWLTFSVIMCFIGVKFGADTDGWACRTCDGVDTTQ